MTTSRRALTGALTAMASASLLLTSLPASAYTTAGTPLDARQAEWYDCNNSEYVSFLRDTFTEYIPAEDRHDLSTLECGNINAPLDYSGKTSGDLTVGFVRIPATGEKRGTLFVNPGGPSGSSVVFAMTSKPFFTDNVREHFDIVGIDPRGVGEHSTFFCAGQEGDGAVDALLKAAENAPLFPYKSGDFVVTRKVNSIVEKRCANSDIPHARFMTTADVARDMDLVRGAIGEDTLNYYGASYGSYLGATYANMFPKHARAIVVDSAIDANGYAGMDMNDSLRRTTWERVGGHLGMQATMERLSTICAESGKCGIDGTLMDLHKSAYMGLRDKPLTEVIDGETLSLSYDKYFATLNALMRMGNDGLESIPMFVSSVVESQNNTEASPVMANAPINVRKALASAEKQGVEGWQPLSVFAPGTPQQWASSMGSAEARAAHKLNRGASHRDGEETPDGELNEEEQEELLAEFLEMMLFTKTFNNIICTDSVNSPSADQWMNRAAALREEVPGFGPMWAAATETCSSWPYKGANAYQGPFNNETPGGVLVVNYTQDPATPLEGAQRLHKTLANSSLVTVDGFGHGALAGSACARDIAGEYIVSGDLPTSDASCTADVLPFAK